MPNDKARIIPVLMSSLSLIFIFLFPIFILPTTTNIFDHSKLALTVIFTVIQLILFSLHILTTKRLPFTLNLFTTPLIFLGLIYLISSFFAAPNPTDALVGRGLFIPLLILFTLITASVIEKREYISQAFYTLIASATALSFLSIFQSLGIGLSNLLNRLAGTNFTHDLSFTPAGSPLSLIVFLAPIALIALIMAFHRKESLERIALFLFSSIITAGLVLVITYSLPSGDNSPVFLPHRFGYTIALETLKDTKTALLGFGPEQFVNAYNRNRPANINTTEFWNIRFTSSSSELLQTITTTGILGFLCLLWIAISLLKSLKFGKKTPTDRLLKAASVGLLLLMIIIPATYLHYFILLIILMLWTIYLKSSDAKSSLRHLDLKLDSLHLVRPHTTAHRESVTILPILFAAPALIISVALLYYFGRAYAAELTFKSALDAAARNEGVATYDLQREAILRNPHLTRYHRAYSSTNLALANSIAAKEDLTDEDRANISRLVQQAIREAKAAVTLDPTNAQNWENLTFIYRSLINVAQNADSWTIASLAQAIQNDPVNPRLRLELGGIYYALGRYDQAIRLYQQAAELKPNWANAFYNLSSAHRQKEEFAQSFDYMRQVLRLVPQDSADYAKAQAELEELAKLLNVPETESQTPPPTGELESAGDPVPTPNPDGNTVDLPEEAGPPHLNRADADVSPTPTSDATPAPSPTTIQN